MLIFNNKVDLNKHLQSIGSTNSTVGFVPTMGALHEGHLSLLRTSLENNTFSVISIFVNPTQFNNPEDLKKYPRTLEKDVEKIKLVSDSIIVYAPSVDDIYDGNTISKHFDYDGLENQMEGKFRPGHFDGVGTVVKRLFEIVKPNNAYFGECFNRAEKDDLFVTTGTLSDSRFEEIEGIQYSDKTPAVTVYKHL